MFAVINEQLKPFKLPFLLIRILNFDTAEENVNFVSLLSGSAMILLYCRLSNAQGTTKPL